MSLILAEFAVRFGKHKGLTGSEILKVDPGYLIWAVRNEVCVDPSLIAPAFEAYSDQLEKKLEAEFGFDDDLGLDWWD